MQTVLEIRYLLAVITLAEELNFTRAAKRLKISQSGLSRRLNELENRLRLKLFDRNQARVELTDAGRAFVEEARLSLIHNERAIQFARAVNEGAESNLTLGHSLDTEPGLISILLSMRLPLHPALLVYIQSDFTPELVHGLLTSKLDLALIANPGSNRKLTTTTVSRRPFYIALPEGHPATKKKTVVLSDLNHATWILFDRKVHPQLHDLILRRAGEEGIVFRDNQSTITADEAVQLVQEGVGVAFLAETSAIRRNWPGMEMRRLEDKDLMIETCLATRADNRSKLVSEFVRAFMKRIAQEFQAPQMSLPMEIEARAS